MGRALHPFAVIDLDDPFVSIHARPLGRALPAKPILFQN
ncbi:protein of unknown function [Trichlorobacter ammonificans]|uniref:Uncharacterized protein n=1 Tax=Trichlorobacter ammonificans TaxID=2916410 RepID=A0ABM9D662_9BACT|nr:protein of unknown function [Trichlorobacter ammonificans]